MYNQYQMTMTNANVTPNNNLNFNEVYNQFSPMIANFLRTKIKSNEEREDMLAEVHIKLYKHLETYNPNKGQLNTWLFTVVNNMVTDHYRKVANDKEVNDADLVNADGERGYEHEADGVASDNFENKELHRKIRRAIRTLRPIEKTVAILCLVKEYSYSEIAEMLEIPENSVKVYILRAKENLQKSLKNEYAMLG